MSSINDEFLAIFLDEARDVLDDWERHCLKLQESFSSADCDALFRAAHNLKGSARSVGLSAFATFIHAAEDLITLVRSGAKPYTPSIAKALLDSQSLLVAWRGRLVDDPQHEPVAEAAPIVAALREQMSSGAADDPAPPAEESFGIFDAGAAPAASAVQGMPADAKAGPVSTPKRKIDPRESVRVPSVKIDALMQLVGELVTQQSTIVHAQKTGTLLEPIPRNAIQIAHKLTRELQLQTMSLRLHDVTQLFQRLERTARDLAASVQKPIKVELIGTDVEVEKVIIERVTDALVHIVRNAVDHGIEAKGERGAKPETATLKVIASRDLSGVVIVVEEDGRGIDAASVLKKAQKMGLAAPNANPLPSEIYNFLFAPGFSTAKQVTEISGRGVGLDVVRRTIDEIGGSVAVASRPGLGTRFTITLPVTVSIVDSLVVTVDAQNYVIPLQEVSEVIDVNAFDPAVTTANSATISLRERPVTVRRLSSFLGRRVTPRPPSTSDSPDPAVVIAIDGRMVAFTFDALIGQMPIVVRDVATYLAAIPGFTGSAILPNGEPAVILSPKIFARDFFKYMEAG